MKDQRSNPDAERIRELLDKAAPRNPDTVGRADAVARRARRARTTKGVASGVGVAALAAAVIVAPHLLRSSPTTNEATDPTNGVVAGSGADAAAALDNPCPEQDGLFDGSTDKTVIPPGATSIRLCPVGLSGVAVAPWEPPVDALVEVAGFYDLIADEEAADPSRCMATTPIPDPLFFQVVSEDGSFTTAFSGSMCSDIGVGGTAYPTDTVLKDYFRALSWQRSELTPPEPAAAACPPRPESGSWAWDPQPDTRAAGNAVTDVVSGVVCYLVDPLGGREYADDEGELSDDQIQAIVEDLAVNQTAQPQIEGGCIDTGPTRIVVLVNAWGDRTSWVDGRCTAEFEGGGGYWLPSAAAEDIIVDALGGTAGAGN